MQIVQDYARLHEIPELGKNLPKTVAYVKSRLTPLGCRIFSPTEGSVCAWFDFGKPYTVAFRADMDALSFPDGAYHACGHDGHTAILLELARRLQRQKQLRRNVLLLFQPAEETDGGAKPICQTGLLEQHRARCIFGLHLWPGLEKGAIFSRPGPLMSSSCGIEAAFTGKSRHIATGGVGGDALKAAVNFYHAAGRLRARQPFLLKFGALQAGAAGNIICGKAVLKGSLRTFDQQTKKALCAKLRQRAAAVANNHRVTADLQISQGYPAVQNDPKLYERMLNVWPVKWLEKPSWTTDDFAVYQQHIPGVYVLLGLGDTPPLHSREFCFDPAVLNCGADCFLHIAQTADIG